MDNRGQANRWRKPAIVGLFVLMLVSSLFFIYGLPPHGEEEEGNDANSSREPGLRKIRVVLDACPNAGHAFLFAAEAKGYLREQGFVLEPIVAGEGEDPLLLLHEGKADLALASQPRVLLARQEGRAVVSVVSIVREPLVYLTVPKNSPIHQPAHLDGKTVGLSGDPVHEAILNTMLDDVRGDTPDVKRVKVGRKFAEALRDQRADAVIGPTILDGLRQLERHGMEARVIEPMLYGVPRYHETVLVAHERTLAEEPDVLERIWSALASGFEDVSRDPEGTVKWLSNAGVFDGNPAWTIPLESLEQLLPFMRTGTSEFGSQDKDAWHETEKWLTDLDLIDFLLDADDAFVDLAGSEGSE